MANCHTLERTLRTAQRAAFDASVNVLRTNPSATSVECLRGARAAALRVLQDAGTPNPERLAAWAVAHVDGLLPRYAMASY